MAATLADPVAVAPPALAVARRGADRDDATAERAREHGGDDGDSGELHGYSGTDGMSVGPGAATKSYFGRRWIYRYLRLSSSCTRSSPGGGLTLARQGLDNQAIDGF